MYCYVLSGVIEQPSVGICSTELLTALHGSSLAVEGRSYDTIHILGLVLHNLCGIAGILQTLLQALGISNHRERTNDDAKLAELGTIDHRNILTGHRHIVEIVDDLSLSDGLGLNRSDNGVVSNDGLYDGCLITLIGCLSLSFLVGLLVSLLTRFATGERHCKAEACTQKNELFHT